MTMITVLRIRERADGRWFITVKRDIPEAPGESETQTFHLDPPNQEEDLRTWLALQGEIDTVLTDKRDTVSTDIKDLVGRSVEATELRQRFKPQLDTHNARVAQAEQERAERNGPPR